MTRVAVDRDRCIGAGQCVLTAPHLFDQSEEDGRVELLNEHPPPDQVDTVREAVALCPSGAIRLATKPGPALARMLRERNLSAFDVIGRWRGVCDLTLPHVLFLLVYAVAQRLTAAIWAAVIAALVLAGIRLARRESFWQPVGGLAGIALSALIAAHTGRGQDFFLPNLIRGLVVGVAFLGSMAVRWPLIGVVVGPAVGQRLTWRKDRRQLRAYQLCTGLWAAVIAGREAVQIPLYFTGNVVALGITHVLMGLPLFGALLYACWWILRRANA